MEAGRDAWETFLYPSEAHSERSVPVKMSERPDVLLVGEGNFSFSVAVCESGDVKSITASCLQTEQQAVAQEHAAHNLQRLRDRGETCGITSRYRVSSTCLQ